MYFGSSGELEGHLNDDWSVLLRNLKAREELLHELLQYNHRVIRQRLQEDELFTNDQILHHHARIATANHANAAIDAQEAPLLAKYEATVVSWDGVAKLMQRVGARVLETYQLSLEQCKALDEELVEKHGRVRQALVRLLNQRDRIDLEAIATLVVGFARTNLLAEIDRLRRIVEALESGELAKLREVYDFRARRASLQLAEKQKAAAASLEKAKNSSLGREDRSPIREEIRRQEKARKQKQKVATRLAHGLYSMLELSRQQLVEDICGVEPGKAVRLYNEIFSRNRLNHMQILAFEAKKDEFLEKTRLFREMMERESHRIAQALAQKTARRRPKDKQHEEEGPPQYNSELIIQDVAQDDPASEKKIASTRYRIQSPRQKREVREFLSSFSSVMQPPKDNFNHFKFDTSNQEVYARTNRNRLPLPQIPQNTNSRCANRASSLDHRLELNKTKLFRRQEEDNEEAPREAAGGGAGGVGGAGGAGGAGKEEKYMAQRARFAVKNVEMGTGERKAASKDTRKIDNFEPHPMQYTFYVRKNSRKLQEVRLNALL